MPGEHNLSGSGISLGNVGLDGRAVMAPLSGVTDVAFRRIARRFGAGAVISEMVASDDYVRGAAEARLRAEGEGVAPHVVQLAGCDPYWIGEAARVAEANGAAVIDINMGCPAKKVTGADARSRPGAKACRRGGLGLLRAGDGEDAPRLGRGSHQRARACPPLRSAR